MASAGRFAYAFVKAVEVRDGMEKESADATLAYDDAAVVPVADSVAGLEHGAVAGHGGVVANPFQFLAVGALGACGEPCRDVCIGALQGVCSLAQWDDDRHLAGVLVTTDECHTVGAHGKGGGYTFGRVADVFPVDGELAVDGIRGLVFSCQCDVHGFNNLTF